MTASILTTFTSTSTDSDGTIVSSAWDFGDGFTATGTSVEHVFPIAGGAGSAVTVAGTSGGFSGDGGLATAAKLNSPYDVAVDSAGNIYIADTYNHRIRKVTASTGIITTIAGTGTGGYNGDNILATTAQLNEPHGVCVDSAGDIYIGDSVNQRVRKITASTGIITTIAGQGGWSAGPGESGSAYGDGGLATNSVVYYPRVVRLDSEENLYIHQYSGNRIRKINKITGIITTVAGYYNAELTGADFEAFAEGAHAVNVSLLGWYHGLGLDSAGNIYITYGGIDPHYNDLPRITKIDAVTNLISFVAGNGVEGYSGDGGLATSAQIRQPYGVAVDAEGAIYISDSGGGVIRKVLLNGTIKTLAGVSANGLYGEMPGYTFNYDDPNGGGQAVNTALGNPASLCVGADYSVYVAHRGEDRILKLPQRQDYDVTLTVTDNAGATDSSTQTVTVSIDDWPLHNARAVSIIASAVCWWPCNTGTDYVSGPPDSYQKEYRVSLPNSITGAPLLYGGGEYGQVPGNYNLSAGTGYTTPSGNYLYISTAFRSRETIPALATNNWTIGGKFRVPALGVGERATFLAYRQDSGVDSIAVAAHGDGSISLLLNGGEVSIRSDADAFELDELFGMDAMYDGANLRLYIDSSIAAQAATSVDVYPGDYFYLAAPSAWQVFICDAALSPAEVAYANGREYSRILTDSTA